MARKLIDLFRLAMPLPEEKRKLIAALAEHIDSADVKEIAGLVKQKKADIAAGRMNVSPQLLSAAEYPEIVPKADDKQISEYAKKINSIVLGRVRERSYRQFSEKAAETIPRFIGMNIVGLEEIKKAASLQLFSPATEPVHMLLLGDPGTGKTDILRSAAALHPVSSFGLGSGTTGVGLTVTVKGEQVSKGLLPMADKGLCAIDELNLMEDKDRASLYNAMEKGFITYDKGGKHYKFDARVSVIATANPKGDRFVGWTLETLKRQLPFDSALLTRFHLVFLVRKPDVKQFVEISRRIVRSQKSEAEGGDESFIKGYVAHCQKLDVEIPPSFEHDIVDFVGEIKKNERRYLIEVSPRLVLGFIRLAKASARMRMSRQVNSQDIANVKAVVEHGLKVA